mgnify:FL=1
MEDLSARFRISFRDAVQKEVVVLEDVLRSRPKIGNKIFYGSTRPFKSISS